MFQNNRQKRGNIWALFQKRTAMLVLSLAFAALIAGCGGAEEREAKYVERGKALYDQGDLVKAEVEFKNALQINPRGLEARYYMGLIAEREGNLPKAYRSYRSIVAEQPDHFRAHLKLAQYYALARQFDDAEKEAQIADGLEPNDPELITVHGNIAYGRKNYDEARRRAEAALAIDPEHEGAHLLLGKVLQAGGAGDEALRQVDHAIALNPNSVALRLLKASIYLERDQLDQVRAVYEELFAIEPENHRYRASLAQIYISRGRAEEAEGVLRAAVDAGLGGDETKLNLIDLIAATEGVDAAAAQARQFSAAEPDKHIFAFKLVSLYDRHGRRAEAAATLQDVIDRSGTEQAGLDARIALARLSLAEGDGARATALVTEVLNADPANADGLLMRAAFSLDEGQVEPAIADLRAVLRDRPNSTPALRLLAHAQTLRGDVAVAMDTLKRIVELDKTDIDSRQKLATHLAQRGNNAAALTLLDEILEIDPNSVAALQAKAGVLATQQNWAEAQAIVERLREMPEHQALAHTIEGGLHYAQGRYGEAVTAYDAAHRLSPTAVEPITGMTMSYLAQGAPEEAASFLESVLEQDPNSALAHNLLGETRLRQNKLAEAEEQFRLAISAPDDWAIPYLNLARLLIGRGDSQEALAVYQAGLEKLPDNLALQLAYAEAQEMVGDFAGARSTYEAVVKKHQDNAVAANNLAALLADYHYEDPESVRHALQLARRFEGSSNPLFVDTLGWVQFRLGDLAQARVNLERAVALMPHNPQLQYHLGMVLTQLGEHEAAVQALKKAVVDGAQYRGIDEARSTLAEVQRQQQETSNGETSG